MDFTNETTESLRIQFTALVKSKFTPPYLKGEQRRLIDEMIFKIWQELKSRD